MDVPQQNGIVRSHPAITRKNTVSNVLLIQESVDTPIISICSSNFPIFIYSLLESEERRLLAQEVKTGKHFPSVPSSYVCSLNDGGSVLSFAGIRFWTQLFEGRLALTQG